MHFAAFFERPRNQMNTAASPIGCYAALGRYWRKEMAETVGIKRKKHFTAQDLDA